MNKPLLFGHRGCPSLHPENSLSGFRACVEYQIDGIELDVQLTKDKKLIVFHDADLNRIARIDATIADLPYEEIKKIDLGEGQHIPLLEEVFLLCQDKLLYDIEIKARDMKNHQVETALYQMIQKYSLEKECMVSSFNPVSLLRFKKVCKQTIKTAVIYSDETTVPRILRKGFARHLVHPSCIKPESKHVERALNYGYPVIAWTVDSVDEAERLLAMGVKGLISNNPEKLKPLFST